MSARVLRLGCVAAVALQLYVLYLYVPGPEEAVTIPHADKAVHAVVFALPALLGVLAGWRARWVALVLALHAPLSELVQHLWLPDRAGDPWDVVADWAGIALGVLVALMVRRGLKTAVAASSGRSAASSAVD